MAKSPQKEKQKKPEETPVMPFDEALKRVWSAKPQPKKTKEKKKKK